MDPVTTREQTSTSHRVRTDLAIGLAIPVVLAVGSLVQHMSERGFFATLVSH